MAHVAEGRIRLRSNIVDRGDAWYLVPGEVLATWRPDLMRQPNRPTQLQTDEHMYYVPCTTCGRTINVIMREGCHDRRCVTDRAAPTPLQVENAQEDHRRGLDAVRAARLQLGMNTPPDRGDG